MTIQELGPTCSPKGKIETSKAPIRPSIVSEARVEGVKGGCWPGRGVGSAWGCGNACVSPLLVPTATARVNGDDESRLWILSRPMHLI